MSELDNLSSHFTNDLQSHVPIKEVADDRRELTEEDHYTKPAPKYNYHQPEPNHHDQVI